jgi:uncharacterized membrane protein
MFDRILNLWLSLRESLWFVPFLMSMAGFLLAYLALTLETGLEPDSLREIWWLYSGGPSDARALLSTLLSSMFTLTTLIVSITMVVLSLAATQLGPRLIRSFMGDRTTQVVLGVFAMTIAYLVLVLRSVTESMEFIAVPHGAVTLGTVLALASVFVLLFFVHHLARSLMTNHVVARVSGELRASIERLLPSEAEPESAVPNPEVAGEGSPVVLNREGYLQAVAWAEIVDAARKADAIVGLAIRPGHFIVRNTPVGAIYPAARANDELLNAIKGAVIVGTERTSTQDLEYSIRHLVEIALRALSPGINDPFTAELVLDHLGAALAEALRRPKESPLHRDESGAIRVVGVTSNDRGLIEASFNQIRQAGAGHPAMLIHMLDTLGSLAPHVRAADQRRALLDQIEAIGAAARRSISESFDLGAIEERRRKAFDALAEPS